MSDEYDEIQFAAHHSRFRSTPNLEQHSALYRALLRMPGVIPYRQQFPQGRDEQHALAVIIQDQGRRRELQEQIRSAAQANQVGIDLVHRRPSDYVDRVLRNDLPGQYSELHESTKPCVSCRAQALLDDSGLCKDCVDTTTYEVLDKLIDGERYHVINRRHGVRVFASNDKGVADAAAADWTAGRRAEAISGRLRTSVRGAIDAVASGQPVPATARKLTAGRFNRGDLAEYVDDVGQAHHVTVLREHKTMHGRGYIVRAPSGRNIWAPVAALKPRAA